MMPGTLDLVRSWLEAATFADLGVFALRLTLIAAAGRLALAALPRASAANRHLIAVASLASLLALPLASTLLPALRVPVLPATAAASVDETPATDAAPGSATRSGPSLDATGRFVEADHASGGAPSAPRPFAPSAAGLVAIAALAVSAVLLLRAALAMAAASRVACTASRVEDADLLGALGLARAAVGLRRDVALRETSRLSVPAVWGLVAPTLLLPAAARAWSRDRLSAVFLHELAHVARFDGLSLLVGRAATAAFWFHPLVWALARDARRECEHACDDVVLTSGARASSYAAHLLAIAEGAWARDPLAGVAPAFARRSKLERRLVAILRPNARRGPASRRALAWTALAAALVALPIATARIVAAAVPADPEPASAPASALETPPVPAAAAPVSSPEPVASATTAEAGPAHGPAFRLAGTRSGEDWYDLAKEYYDDRRYQESGDAYVHAAAGRYRIGTALYNAACSYALAGMINEAIVSLGQSLDAGFDRPELLASDDDLDALRSDPRFQKLSARAKGTDRVQQRRVAAVAEYDRLRASRSTDTGDWHRVGIDQLRLDEYDRAADAFARQNAIEESSNAIYNIACAKALAGDRDAAFAALERSIVSGGGNGQHMRRDADLRSLRGDPRFERLADLAADLRLETWTDVKGPSAWRSDLGRYERVAREHPTIGRAWHNLGYARLRADDLPGAVVAFGKALDLEYRPPTTMYNLACVYAQMRKADEAIRWLERAEAAGMDVADKAYQDDDLNPLRLDPRFRRMLARWSEERRAERQEKWKEKS